MPLECFLWNKSFSMLFPGVNLFVGHYLKIFVGASLNIWILSWCSCRTWGKRWVIKTTQSYFLWIREVNILSCLIPILQYRTTSYKKLVQNFHGEELIKTEQSSICSEMNLMHYVELLLPDDSNFQSLNTILL